MDPLIELPVELWPMLRDKVKYLWPINVGGYYALDLSIKNLQATEKFQLKVYCPYGSMENGFVATTVTSPNYLDILIFNVNGNISKLEEALVATNIFDKNQERITISMVTSAILKSLYRIEPKLSFERFDVVLTKTFFLDKASEKFDVRFPQDTYMEPVRKEHLRRINETWEHAYDGSYRYYRNLASCGLTYGFYYKEELAAWTCLNEYHNFRHIYCEKKYRRRGFTTCMMKHIINENLDKGNDLYCFVVNGNEKSMQFLQKLGFEAIDQAAKVFLTKHRWNTN